MVALPKEPSNILVIDLAMIGDLVCATPALESLRAFYPEAVIHVLASRTSMPALMRNPHISGVSGIDKREVFSSPVSVSKAARTIRKSGYEIAFLFHNSFGAALLAWLARIPNRVGYPAEMRGNLLTHRVAPPKDRLHLVEARLNLLRKSGVRAQLKPPVFCVDETAAESTVSRLLTGLDSSRPLVAISVGSTWPTKIWPKQRVQAFLNKLPVGSVSVVLIGSAEEASYAQGLSSISVPVYNIVGKTTLEELGHILFRADAVVAPDSGPMHMAAGLGKPVIGLFGPTDPKLCGMLHDKAVHIRPNSPCMCCWEKKCNFRTFCMDMVGEDEVLESLFAILPKQPASDGMDKK